MCGQDFDERKKSRNQGRVGEGEGGKEEEESVSK
jgi:hypothetical protein